MVHNRLFSIFLNILNIHKQFIEAGANIIGTNTFNSNAPSMSDYGMEDLVYELNFAAAQIVKEAIDFQKKTDEQDIFIAGVLGPSSRTCSLSPDVEDPAYRNISFDQLVDTYTIAVMALLDGGADLILVETIFRFELYKLSCDNLQFHPTLVGVPPLPAQVSSEDAPAIATDV